jgi:peptide/nickel transport system substrate-binding protein
LTAMRRLLLLFLALLAFPAWAKDELVLGMNTAPGTMNPLINAMMAKSVINSMTLRPLTAYDASWKLVCMVCTELPSVENGHARVVDLADGKKGMEIDVELKPLVWGDGTPLAARDFQLTVDIGKHPMSGVSSSEEYRRVVKFDIKDDRHFTLTMDRVTFDYNSLSLDPVPSHIEKPIFDANPAEYRNKTAFDTDATNPGLAFGPYHIAELVRGSRIVLEPNPHWTGAKPQFKRLVVKIFEDSSALEANLLSGNVDYILGESGLSLDQALAFEKRHSDKYNVVFKPSLSYAHVDVKLDNPPLSDKAIRQALLMAIDRKTISDKLFAGKQPVADGEVNPLDPMYSSAARHYPYDPGAAKKLLDEAGYSEIKNGVRQNAKGERLSIELAFASGNRILEQLSQVMQSQLRQVGIELRLKSAPARIYFDALTRRDFGGLAMYSWITRPENVPRTTLHSSEIPTAQNGWSGQNYPGYANPAMDKALDAAERELDRDKRRAYFAEIQRLYAEDLPVLPMYFRVDSFVVPKGLKGVVPTGHQFPSTLWVENWGWED